MMAFNETFGDRIINLYDSPDGDSHFFLYLCHLNQKKEACSLLLQGNLICHAVMCMWWKLARFAHVLNHLNREESILYTRHQTL